MWRLVARCIYLSFLFSICAIFAILTVFRMGMLMITKGPKKMFRKTPRNEEPACLLDPQLGTHGYVHLEDVKIHYVSNGASEKPLMLLLHGFPESWYSWRHQLKEFCKDYRVVAIDQRGYGGSDKPSGIREYQMEKLVKDVKQIIPALGYSSCVMVGHDWGGAVTWAFAGCYPEMVDKVIVLNCPHVASFKKYLYSHWTQFKKSWYMFFFLVPLLPEIYIGLSDQKFFEIIFKGRKGGVLTEATTQEDVEAYKYLFQKRSSLTGPINYIRAAYLCKPYSRMARPVKKPVLLIWGCRDIALETGLAEACREMCPELNIKYLEKASHWVQMDEPDVVNAHIRQFLSS